jgi:transposase
MNHRATMDLTDDQWVIIQPLILDHPRRSDGKGILWRDARRDIMNGVLLWILLLTGAPWYDMPDRYLPAYQTCHHRRFQQWVRTGGVFEKILHTVAADLQERGGLDLSERYIDGTFIVAKKREGNEIGRAIKLGKGTKKLMAISDNADGLPISVYITSTASPHHEVTLDEATFSKCFVTDEKPERLIGEDKAYDSDPLVERLDIEYGVELISPHIGGWRRKRPKKTQDGIPLRRYKHRWKI